MDSIARPQQRLDNQSPTHPMLTRLTLSTLLVSALGFPQAVYADGANRPLEAAIEQYASCMKENFEKEKAAHGKSDRAVNDAKSHCGALRGSVLSAYGAGDREAFAAQLDQMVEHKLKSGS